MIPIKLSIQGLYSYQDIQEIDFQRLIGANVFGIFGKVGSGKTSLLEAISFALYGETERLNSRDNRQYNMMNLKSKQLKIDFEFQAGSEQQIYKFVYEAKRHPKKHHEISAGERRMFVRQENEWRPIGNEKEDISILSKQILGLDYENFKRTIIIPQNQFREFLELSPTERTRMMNQLFKLEQYDLAGRVSKLSRINDDQLAELRGRLSPLETVTPEVIEQAKTDIATLSDAIAAKELAIKELEPEEHQLLQAQTQSLRLVTVRKELASLQTQEPIYQQLRRTIALYETCRLVFQADFVNLRRFQDKQNGLTTTIQQTNNELSKIASQLPGLQSIYEGTKLAYEGRHQLQQQIDELDTVQQIRTLQGSIELQNRNRRHVLTHFNEQKDKIDRAKSERQQHQAFVDTMLGQESQLEQLYQVENWFAIYKPLKKQADDLQGQLTEYETTVEQIKQRKNDALVGFPDEWNSFTLKTLPAHIDQALEQLKAIRRDREKTYRQAFVKQELLHYADSLADGVPCPLCGSEHHPEKHETLFVESEADLIRQEVQKSEIALNKVNQRIDDTTGLRLLIEGLAKELRGTLDNGKRLMQDRAKIVQELTEHEDKFVWRDFNKEQEDNLTEAIRHQSDQQKQFQDKQKIVRELSKEIEDVEAAQRTEEQKLNEIDKAIAGLGGQLKTAIDQLEHYRFAEVAEWDLRQITDLRDSLSQAYEQTKINFEAAENHKQEAEKVHVTLTGQLQQLTKQLSDLNVDIEEVEEHLSQNLIKHALTREEVEQVLQTNLDLDLEKQRVVDYNDKCTGLQKQIADLENNLTEHPFDPEALVSVQKELELLRSQKDALNKDWGKAGNVLATLERQWTEKQAYQKQHDELDLRRQDLKKMDELFRAQGFVNYVSSVYLKNLCESANERFFKLTNNQLKLELDDKNNFQVRDYLNGGETRSVKTLSGGQTFQAALSLALALSDNIQHLTRAKQNLFFLDEGFGTLDKDSLQTVFKTLKALRSENRVVGIISHVEELQQEVDTYIRAEATENGSRIVRSWDI
ncbi:AAA family ATPase [Spirosoma sp. KNUC1025]|uniref:AAA family ATPase n=1 Tax=Spirosoma sp. KNUC1025 TaxID=2894082 RepID=UPI003863EB16|nr:SMC family ATPase [Spirosoma sp. KNUC1025]